MATIKIKTGQQIDLEAQKKLLIYECKYKATDRINSVLPAHEQRNIALWGSGYGMTQAEAGDFILAVKTRCDKYEAEINASDDPASTVIDYSDIMP